MDANFEAFVLYYTAFHEYELNTKELKEMLILEIGEEGFAKALVIFRQEREREKREAAGDKRTLYAVTTGA
jgi:uncharacterized protein YqgQ